MKLLTRTAGETITDYLRKKGQSVIVFTGEGMKGPVNELYIASRRRYLKWILPEVKQIGPEFFYIIEQARDIRRILKPVSIPLGGWRSISKRK